MNTQPNQISSSATVSSSATPAAARKGWFSRHWKWLVPTFLIVFIVLPLTFVGSVFAAMKNSEAAKESLLQAQSNPLLVQKLGTPIEEGWLVSGSINTSTTSGDADLAVPISGPKGQGKIYVTAHKSIGIWSYSVMEAAIEGSDQRINLLSDVAAGARTQPMSDAPVQRPQETPPVETQATQIPPPKVQAASLTAIAAVTSPPAAEQAGVTQTQETTYPGVVGELTECRRKEGVLNVKVRFRNTSDKEVLVGIFKGGYEKVYVTANNKKYFILKDSEGAYLTAEGEQWIKPGASFTWWAKYPAPPADVKKINLLTPITTPFDDVPITDQ